MNSTHFVVRCWVQPQYVNIEIWTPRVLVHIDRASAQTPVCLAAKCLNEVGGWLKHALFYGYSLKVDENPANVSTMIL